MTEGSVVIPIPRKRNMDTIKIRKRTRLNSGRLQFKPHGCELAFAYTVHKVQGHTCSKIILQLNKRPFMPKITFNSLLVSLSRVSRGDNIRLMPIHPGGENLSYLSKLEPPKELSEWLSFFDPDSSGFGEMWNIQNARASYSKDKSRK